MTPSVVTILVTTADNERFRETLTAAQQQTYSHQLICVDASRREGISPNDPQIKNHPHTTYCRVADAKNLAVATKEAFNDPQHRDLLEDADFLWILHADSTPEPDTLATLIEAASAGASIAVAGPKQVSPTGELLEVGITATRSGYRVETALPGEPDQGQYDGRQDVLAVGTAGMLVRREVWRDAGGFDTALGPFGDGFEFCRRVRLMGHRVIVVAQARVCHAQESKDGSIRAYQRLRRSVLYLRWLTSPLWLLPVVVLLTLAVQPLLAVYALLTLQPRLAWAHVWVLLGVIADSAHVVKRRVSGRTRARVPRSALSSLELSYKDVWNRYRYVRKRFERLDGQEVDAQLRSAIDRYRHTQRRTRGFLTGLTLLLSLTVWLPFIRQVLSSTVTIQAPAWAQLPRQWSLLWESAWAPFSAPFSEAPVADPLTVFWAVLTAPLGAAGVDPNLALYALLVVALPASVASMWWASSTVTGRSGVRASTAILWGAQPTLWLSVAHAQMASVLVHIVAPLVCATMVRTLGQRRRTELLAESQVLSFEQRVKWRWGAFFAGALLIATAAFPTLVLVVATGILIVTILALLRPTWTLDAVNKQPVKHFLGHVWASLLPSFILTAPYFVAIVRQRAFAALLGPAGTPFQPQGLEGGAPTALDVFFGMPARFLSSAASLPPTTTHVVVHVLIIGALTAPAAISLVLALASVLRNTGVKAVVASLGLASFTLVSLLALLARHVPIGIQSPQWSLLVSAERVRADGYFLSTGAAQSGFALTVEDFLAERQLVGPWLGPWLTVGALILLMALIFALPTSWHQPRFHRVLIGTGLVSIMVTLAAIHQILPLPHPLNTLTYGNGYALPTSLTASHSENGTRSLILIPTEEGHYADIYEADTPVLTEASTITRWRQTQAHDTNVARADLEEAIATLISTADTAAARRLAEHGIDSVIIPQLDTPAVQRLEDQLTQNDALQRGAQTSALHVWRVRPGGFIPREVYTDTDEAGMQIVSLIHPRGTQWELRVDNIVVPPAEHPWALQWQISSESKYSLSHTPTWVSLWQIFFALATSIIILGMRPIRLPRVSREKKQKAGARQ